ncbi:uncharacterized protein LOC110722202 [Chenopodium quinoa]|uniref:uncharacterized protein LOC110722202 n=1 Tax=Chenopodium quinoa TaxID=63459 RepID=UPI000B7844C5|nr:uncharacterized protein LOC110722202 [Chenopodium quinoa]
MMSIRISSLIFVLMFTLLEARDSIFKHHHPLYYHQGTLEAKFYPRYETLEAKGIHQTITPKGKKGKEVSNAKKQKVKSVGTTIDSIHKLKPYDNEAANNEDWFTLMHKDYSGNRRRRPPV